MSLPFLKCAVVSICLTGTPVLNRPVEIFPQLEGLLPDFFTQSTFGGFTKRYCDAKPHRFRAGDDVSGVSNESELRVLLEGLVMIRRMKKDVMSELPDKVREAIFVDPDPDKLQQLKAIRKRLDELQNDLKNDRLEDSIKQQKRNEQQTLMNHFCQVTGIAKIQGIKKELLQLVEHATLERILAESVDDRKNFQMEQTNSIEPDNSKPFCEEVTIPEIEINAEKDLSANKIVERGLLLEIEEDIVTMDMRENKGVVEGRGEDPSRQEGGSLVDTSDELSVDESSPEKKSASTQQIVQKTGRKRLRKCNEFSPTKGRLAKSNAKSKINRSVALEDDETVDLIDDEDEEDLYWNEKDEEISNQKGKMVKNTKDNNDSESDSNDRKIDKKKKGKKITKKNKQQSAAELPAPSYRRLGKKILVFAHHHEVLDAIQELLLENNIVHVRIDGKVTPTAKAKADLVHRFQEDDETGERQLDKRSQLLT